MERKVKHIRSSITALLLAVLAAGAVWMSQYTAQASAGGRFGTVTVRREAASVSITVQPKNVSVTVGGTASFSVKASGNGSLTYRWQAKNPSTGKWVNSSSSSASTGNLKITAQAGHNNFRFRCIITDARGAQTVSEEAVLTIVTKVVTQPKSVAVMTGGKASFSVKATGAGTLKYQWQSQKPGGTWKNSAAASAKTADFSFTAQAAHDGYSFRCVITDGNGNTTATNTVKLTIGLATQPKSTTVVAGTTVKFSVSAIGAAPVSYQWQAQRPGAGTWVNSMSASAKTANLSIKAQAAHNGYKFRCVVTDGKGRQVISDTAKLTVRSWSDETEYADLMIEEYLESAVTSGMSDLDRMRAIAAYPASFDYDYRYQSYVDMIVQGGGDCWASSNLIIRECEMLGIDAWIRNGNKDSGAGSGHRNVMAYYNGKYYELEAGYNGTAPRSYYAKVRDSLFSYRRQSNGISVYQYDGKDYPDTLVIPEQIGGLTVTAVEKSFLYRFTGSEIVFPDTCESIGDYAVTGSTSLSKVHLPAALSTIGQGAFAQDENVTLEIDSSNAYFSVRNNCLYSKDGKTLYAAPSVGGKVTLPSTLTTIRPYAFYYNPNVTEIVIPSAVSSIGEGAFGDCTALAKVTFSGSKLTAIEDFVFAETPYLETVTLPPSVKTLSRYAFAQSGPKNVVLTSTQAPVWSTDDDETPMCQGISFYAPAGAKGYESGAWENLDVSYGQPSS